MINIITVENEWEYRQKNGGCVRLQNDGSVEDEFKQLIECHSTVFKDEMSLKIMQEIDGAKRVGSYGVRTPIGKSCITCLSTSCKLALLLWYYMKKEIVVLTSFARAGINAWEFISENFDIDICMEEANGLMPFALKFALKINGTLYTKENAKEYVELYFEYENKPYQLTKETELEAYEKFKKFELRSDTLFFRNLKEELTLEEFVKSLKTNYVIKDEDLDYQVINYCSVLSNDYRYRKLPIWFVGRKSTEYKFFSKLSVAYPSFWELFLDDIVYGWNDYEDIEYNYFSQQYDEFFALVLKGEERCEVREYPKRIAFGVFCNPKEKLITIYDRNQALENFHELYGKTELK